MFSFVKQSEKSKVSKDEGSSNIPTIPLDEDYVPLASAKAKSSDTQEKKGQVVLAKSFRGMARLGKIKPIPVTLWENYFVSSAAATALVAVKSLAPSGSAEFSQLAVLFDEIIVDSVEYITSFNALANGAVVSSLGAALQVFDPADFTSPSSIISMLPVAQRMKTPFALTNLPAVNTGQGGMVTVNETGFLRWSSRTPRGVFRASALAAAYGHDWSPLSESGDTYGFLKTYIETPPALVTTNVRTFIGYHCHVRSRQ